MAAAQNGPPTVRRRGQTQRTGFRQHPPRREGPYSRQQLEDDHDHQHTGVEGSSQRVGSMKWILTRLTPRHELGRWLTSRKVLRA
jgi:hypothetical protein